MRLARLAGLLLLPLVVAGAAEAQLRSAPFVAGLSAPLAIVQDPADAGVQFVVEQAGRIRVVRDGALAGDFLDLTAVVLCCGERGLLGLAFPPYAETSGRFGRQSPRWPEPRWSPQRASLPRHFRRRWLPCPTLGASPSTSTPRPVSKRPPRLPPSERHVSS